jgi:hypothetical protein
MVKIDWTDAQVVKITARRDFTMSGVTMDTKNRTIVGACEVTVLEGTELHFAKSSMDGWYYVVRGAACTCPAHKACKHQTRVNNYRNGIWHHETVKPAPVQPVAPKPQPEYPPIKRRSAAFWKENAKQDQERQRREKAEYLAKLASVRAADLAAAGIAS